MHSGHFALELILLIFGHRILGAQNPDANVKVDEISIFENIRIIALMPNQISHAYVFPQHANRKYPIDGTNFDISIYLTYSSGMTNPTN